MLNKLKNWLSGRSTDTDSRPRAKAPEASPRPAPKKVPRKTPEFVDADEHLAGEIESNGPGKNVLIRKKYVREDTGTHETLKILDDASVETGEEQGIDPYNTGGFDRSKNWDRRFGK